MPAGKPASTRLRVEVTRAGPVFRAAFTVLNPDGSDRSGSFEQDEHCKIAVYDLASRMGLVLRKAPPFGPSLRTFEELQERMGRMDEQLGKVEKRLDRLEEKMEALDAKLEAQGARITALIDFVRECLITASDTCETEGEVCAPLPDEGYSTCIHHLGEVDCPEDYDDYRDVVQGTGLVGRPFTFTLCCTPSPGSA